MRKFFEKIVEGGLLISGSVSSFTILLIVFFLFKEAGGLFNTPATEEGYVLAVNKSNDVGKLSPEKIIGVPVGFVNVVQSKELIMQADVPYIVARGRKGGSNIAACICNALLYMIDNRRD